MYFNLRILNIHGEFLLVIKTDPDIFQAKSLSRPNWGKVHLPILKAASLEILKIESSFSRSFETILKIFWNLIECKCFRIPKPTNSR